MATRASKRLKEKDGVEKQAKAHIAELAPTPGPSKKRKPAAEPSQGKNRPVPPKKRKTQNAKTNKDEAARAKPSVNADEGEKKNDGRSYWLMKAEPESRVEKGVDVKFSIDDLAAAKEPEGWDGVRNYVARNNMIAMKKGDLAFFYHSNCKVPGVVGIMEIVREHSTDLNAQNPDHPYYDPKATPEKPRWSLVHVEFRRKFPDIIPLKELQRYKGPGEKLENMEVLRMSRLSVSKVSKAEWDFVLQLAESKEE